MKVSNRDAGRMVELRRAFQGSNTYGTEYGVNNYAAFSYGAHWPLFVYYRGTWYGNSEKYSVTTSKHKGQLRPDAEIQPRTTRELQDMVSLMDLEHSRGLAGKS